MDFFQYKLIKAKTKLNNFNTESLSNYTYRTANRNTQQNNNINFNITDISQNIDINNKDHFDKSTFSENQYKDYFNIEDDMKIQRNSLKFHTEHISSYAQSRSLLDNYKKTLFLSAYFNYMSNKNMISSSTPSKSIYSHSKGFRMRSGVMSIPHIKKITKGGEDAYKISDYIYIIADGVGGWNSKGVDPSLFSKTLVNNAYKVFDIQSESLHSSELYEIKFRMMMQEAINVSLKIKGSSTISIFSIDPIKRRGISGYIGDSLIVIMSYNLYKNKYQVKFISTEQTHGFNIPYQVGYDCDSAENAIITEHQLCNLDIIIIASDGLWDNLSIKSILNLINQVKDEYNLIDCEQISHLLVKQAQVVSYSKTAITPFSLKSKESGGNKLGGKMDDISVIVLQVDIHDKEYYNYIISNNSGLNKTNSFNNNSTGTTDFNQSDV